MSKMIERVNEMQAWAATQTPNDVGWALVADAIAKQIAVASSEDPAEQKMLYLLIVQYANAVQAVMLEKVQGIVEKSFLAVRQMAAESERK